MSDILGSLIGSANSSGGGGSFFSPGNILGALVVGSQIFGQLGEQDRQEEADNWQRQQAAEEQRRWQAEFDFSKEKWLESLKRGAGGGGGSGAGAALAIQKSKLIENAYTNLIAAVQAGRDAEAKQLGGIISAVQRPLLRTNG